MLALLEKGLLPNFAFNGPWVQDLLEQGKDREPPDRLCWAAEDAILLAPYRVDQNHWGGFLIAQSTAANQTRQFASEAGDVVMLTIPKTVLQEGSFAGALAAAILAIEGRENSG